MNTPASAVVPSREAVEDWAQILISDGWDDPAAVLLDLLAEVERLTEALAVHDLAVQTARHIMADQAAALAERDKDAERYRCIRADDFDTSKLFLQTDCIQEGHTFGYIDQIFSSERLDAAIDAALAASVSSAREEG